MNERQERNEEYAEINQSRMQSVMVRALLARLKEAERIIMDLTTLLNELTANTTTLTNNLATLQAQEASLKAELATALANQITPDHTTTLSAANDQIVAANKVLEALVTPAPVA